MKKTIEKHSSPIYQELCEKIGVNKIKDDEAILISYGFDSSITPFSKPSLVVLPENRDDVREILMAANREKIPVTVMAGGVNVGGMCVPSENGIVLDFRNMNRILEVNTDAGYAVIEPGVIFDRFTSELRKVGYKCHVPTAPGGATPLGNYLLQPSGSLSNRHLDSIIELEVVLPDGLIFHTGSATYPSKNAKPYRRYGPFPDVAGLLTCAYGTLGIITKASVKIYPINESTRVNLTAFDDYASAGKFVQEIVRANIPEHCIIWNWQFYKSYDISLEDLNNPYIPTELYDDPRKPPKGLPYNIVTTLMSGYTEIMDIAESTCAKVAEKYGGGAISWNELEEKAPGAARAWREFYLEHHQPRMEHNKKYGLGRYSAWIAIAEPKDIIDIEPWAVKTTYDLGIAPVMYYSQPFDFGRCLFFRMFSFYDPQDQKLLEKVRTTQTKMYKSIMEKYGATPERYRRDQAMIQQLGGYYEFLKRIKKAVDPNNILNPGIGLFFEEDNK
jgi:FAD/FMN-containing dehydrogenase